MTGVDNTPTPCTPIPSSSSPSMEIATPPDSVRRYANALKAFTRVGMDAAIADSQDESRIEERRFDVEFGYDDEDPIERHVRLYLTPKKGTKDASMGSAMREDQDVLHVDVEMEQRVDEIEGDGPGGMARPFRPGLIHFQRSSRGSMPSLSGSGPSYTRTDSTMSTPFGFDADHLVRDMDTPGSTWSDASFEALKADDWVSLYGPQGGRKRLQSWSGEVDEADNRNSMSSDITAQASSPPAGPSKRPSLLRPRPRACPYPPPPEVIRSRQNSGRYDTADCREYNTEPRSRTTSGGSAGSRSRQSSDNIPTATLGSLSCRSRQSSDNATISSLGPRSRQSSDDIKIAKLSALGLGPAPVDEDDEDWMMGRTISETMVVQAGFRSQKGRPAMRAVR